jgi:hypothetical protein
VARDPILVAVELAGFARSGMRPLVRAMRPGEWVKNLLVLSPRAEDWVLAEPIARQMADARFSAGRK